MTHTQLRRRVWKPALWIACLIPLGLLVFHAFRGELSANPVEDITNTTGIWTLRLIVITILITPLRWATGINQLIQYRRAVGLFAFFYGSLHFMTYFILDQQLQFGGLWEDVKKRPYITAGFTAFVLLIPLALTSTTGWIRRMGGKNWNLLHRLIYITALAAVLHYFWKVKLDATNPIYYGIVVVGVAWCARDSGTARQRQALRLVVATRSRRLAQGKRHLATGLDIDPQRGRVDVRVALMAVACGALVAASAVADPVDDYVRAQMKSRGLPGVSVAIVKDGQIIKADGYGVASLELQVPATRDTVYEIGSISKQFAADAILLLVEDGKVGLDDRLSTYIDNTPPAWSSITVRHVLTHTAGLADFDTGNIGFSYRHDYTPSEFVELLAKQPVQFAPGEQWNYTNGFPLLGMVVERASGRTVHGVRRRSHLQTAGPRLGALQEGRRGRAESRRRLPADGGRRLSTR